VAASRSAAGFHKLLDVPGAALWLASGSTTSRGSTGASPTAPPHPTRTAACAALRVTHYARAGYPHTAMQMLRIATLKIGFGTGRQRMVHERETNPKLSRRTCTCGYGLQSCRGESGVANRPREPPPTRNP
jgi:hypothetical protein